MDMMYADKNYHRMMYLGRKAAMYGRPEDRQAWKDAYEARNAFPPKLSDADIFAELEREAADRDLACKLYGKYGTCDLEELL